MSRQGEDAMSFDCGRTQYRATFHGYCYCAGCVRLHDAAPAMLEALKALVDDNSMTGGPNWERGVTAIAEAEGRAS